MEEAQVVPFHLLLHHHPHLHRRNRKERQAYSLLQTTMEPLPHGLWSCPSKPLTGRTGLQTEGRFSRSTGTTGDTPCWIQDYSHYRTRTRHNSRRHASLATPLRLHISCRNNDKPTGSSLLATNLQVSWVFQSSGQLLDDWLFQQLWSYRHLQPGTFKNCFVKAKHDKIFSSYNLLSLCLLSSAPRPSEI